jgi:hypothetical protein
MLAPRIWYPSSFLMQKFKIRDWSHNKVLLLKTVAESNEPIRWMTVIPSSWKHYAICSLCLPPDTADLLHRLLLYFEDGSTMFLRNINEPLPNYRR